MLQPVLQPNGQLAVYSTVPDHFVVLDEPVEFVLTYYARRFGCVRERERELIQAVADGKLPPQYETWADHLTWALFMHGLDDGTVQQALELTPRTLRRVILARAEDIRDRHLKECGACGNVFPDH